MKDILKKPHPFPNHTSPNRLVAQAMEINSGDGGAVTPTIIERYIRLAVGGWGMVFVEATSITERHIARRRGLVMTKDRLDGVKRLVESFKKINDKSLLLVQLTHSGRMSGPFSNPVKAYDDETDIPVISEAELDEATEDFIAAASLAHEAGADGVDIKACHGYLAGELMRPKNTRGARYGISTENRSRLVSAAISGIKQNHPDLITGSRISLYEGIRGGCGTAGPDDVIEDLSDILNVISKIVDAGADFINVSAGIPAVTPTLTRPIVEGDVNLYHHFRYAKAVKERFPDIAVVGSAYSAGGEDGIGYATENIGRGYVDFAGFGRQSLADPLFPKKFFDSPEKIQHCVLCGGCSRLLKNQKPVYCTKYGEKPEIG
jgi:2,4-dienoyl-CoA reductase-like NADH-dependent reductase (Old Yellow Enzyme family)